MELIFKLGLTISTIIVHICFLLWLWSQQIDVKATFLRPFHQIKDKAEKPVDWIATRDPNAIYQQQNMVGMVTGGVQTVQNKIIFSEIINTAQLNRHLPFEYKRETLKIIKIETVIGIEATGGADQGVQMKHNVLKNVVCEKF